MRYPMALVLAFGQTPKSLVLVCQARDKELLEVVGIERYSDLFDLEDPQPVGLCHRVGFADARHYPIHMLFQHYDQRQFTVRVLTVDGKETLKVELSGQEIDCTSFSGQSNPMALIAELEVAWTRTVLAELERRQTYFLKPVGSGGRANVVLRATTPFTNQEIKCERFTRGTTN